MPLNHSQARWPREHSSPFKGREFCSKNYRDELDNHLGGASSISSRLKIYVNLRNLRTELCLFRFKTHARISIPVVRLDSAVGFTG